MKVHWKHGTFSRHCFDRSNDVGGCLSKTDALVPRTALVKILKIPGDRALMTFQGPRLRGDRWRIVACTKLHGAAAAEIPRRAGCNLLR